MTHAPTSTAHPHEPAQHIGEGSLMDGLAGVEPGSTKPSARSKPRGEAWQVTLRRVYGRMPAPLRNRRVQGVAIAVLLIGAGVGAYFALRPVPQPDYAMAPMDEVLNYTLLTDEFNALPVDKRLDLIAELIKRLKSMSAEDSLAMSLFGSAIDTDALREQLMKNAALVAVDKWDQYAVEYKGVPADQRDEFLDNAFIEFTKLAETLSGQPSNKTDEERLAEGREQAKRDKEMFTSGKGPSAGQLARMASFMRDGVGGQAAPQQKMRGQQLMLDMTRHLRGD